MNESKVNGERALAERDAWFVTRDAGPQSSVGDLLRLMGLGHIDPTLAHGVDVAPRRVRTGATLFREGTAAQAIYFVEVGTFKSLHVAEDGYEQVLAFAGRADVLGYDAVCKGLHRTTAIALEDSTVQALALNDLFKLCELVPALDRALHLALSRQLSHQFEIADLMAAVSAEVRLARFILQLSERMTELGQSPRRMLLRMSRREIASHIGVAHETVSRSFATLVQWGCVAIHNRELEIVDRARLLACASSTRGLAEPEAPRCRRTVEHGQPAHA